MSEILSGTPLKEMEMRKDIHKMMLVICSFAALAIVGCGGVSGNTYQAGGGLMQLEFQSGGKATLSMGPQKTACTYTEDSKTVTLKCDGDSTPLVLTIGNDGTLNPPAGSFIGPLTKK
jgi:hypothetical protein